MRLKTTALLKLALYFAVLCPTQASRSGSDIVMRDEPQDDLSGENSFFLIYPPEAQLMCVKTCADYGNLLEAYPKWKGFRHLDLKWLVQALKKEDFCMTFDKDAGLFALRLLSPVPVNPKNPDIMMVPPSSVLKLINFLSKYHKIDESKVSLILRPFARPFQSNEWYNLGTENEKEELKKEMAKAFLMAGNIENAVKVFGLEKKLKHLIALGSMADILFWMFLPDNVLQFRLANLVLSQHFFMSTFDIMSAAVKAKAKRILKTIPDKQLKKFTIDSMTTILKDAIRTRDLETFSAVMDKFSTQNVDSFEILFTCISSCLSGENADILRAILQTIKYEYLDDYEVFFEIMKKEADFEDVATFKILYDWVYFHDSAKMDQMALELIPWAIGKKSASFIRLLLEKDGTGNYKNSLIKHDHILDCIRVAPSGSKYPSPLVTKYLLTKVDSGAGPEFPIIGSDHFIATELLPALIESGNVPSCEVALSRNNLGELVFPFFEISFGTVDSALEKCPQCLIYFPPEVVNNYISLIPGCYKHSPQTFAALMSATNGKPTFSAMNKYITPEYLIELLTFTKKEDEIDLKELFADATYHQVTADPQIQSAFTLIQFTPELYSLLMELFQPSKLSANSHVERSSNSTPHHLDSLSRSVFKMLLSKRDDGAPHSWYFTFPRNVIREAAFLRGDIPEMLLESYQGNLLYGLSLKYQNEDGEETHLLVELPRILERNIHKIKPILSILFRTDKSVKIILNDISIELVKKIAKNCAEKWYSELLLRELENSLPPWAFL